MKRPALIRCDWAGIHPVLVAYHDTEWGVPLHDDHRLFEFLALEGMQAGLSWLTVLKKRDNFRKAFARFDPEKIARFDDAVIQALLANQGIIRNRMKIEAIVQNARAFLRAREDFGTFDAFIWEFVGGTPIRNSWKSLRRLPTRTTLSDAMSKEMKRRGFSFVGTTICYAFMQAVGMVNDHAVDCFRWREITGKTKDERRAP